MTSVKVWTQTIAHVRHNPFWIWDFVTDPYAAEEFAFEMVQKLDPCTDDEQDLIEDIAKEYVSTWRSKWDNMSRREKIALAESLEQFGLDIDYQLI